jgi:hypothetical protein
MDLVHALKAKMDLLEDGNYTPGLKAVLLHIQTAFRHLSRGQETEDDTAFTDAIYRTNQAFEGSLKEAYRVLTGQDPARKSPHEIESYLEKNNKFRPRVLKQLTTYRTEWRNPSTHDYRLDFDENEALLAIVSVSAFGCVLFDQIAEYLAFQKSQAEAEARRVLVAPPLAKAEDITLLTRTAELIKEFCAHHMPHPTSSARHSEAQVIGALHGFLSSAAPDLNIQAEAQLDERISVYADILVSDREERIVIELKRRLTKQLYARAIDQMERYLVVDSVSSGILVFLPDSPSEMEQMDSVVRGLDVQLTIISPAGSRLPTLQT